MIRVDVRISRQAEFREISKFSYLTPNYNFSGEIAKMITKFPDFNEFTLYMIFAIILKIFEKSKIG